MLRVVGTAHPTDIAQSDFSDGLSVSSGGRSTSICGVRIGSEITVSIVVFRSAKERSFAERKTTFIDPPILSPQASDVCLGVRATRRRFAELCEAFRGGLSFGVPALETRRQGAANPKKTLSTKVVEHIFNVLETLRNRPAENVPHVRFGLLADTLKKERKKRRRVAHTPKFAGLSASPSSAALSFP